MDIGLLIVMIALLAINIFTMGFALFVLVYNNKGLTFLKYASEQIHANKDDINNGNAVQQDIVIFTNAIPIIKSRITFLLFILNVNVAMLSFAFFPVLLVTDAWATMSVIGAICNAFAFTMFIANSRTKNKIDATCTPYNTLLTAYEKETDGDDDDCSD